MTPLNLDPETFDIIKSNLQAVSMYTGTLTEIEMLYYKEDVEFYEHAPIMRPDVLWYFNWMLQCGASGKIEVFCVCHLGANSRCRYITYDLRRQGRAIYAYLRAYEQRQVELMQSPTLDHMLIAAKHLFEMFAKQGKTKKEAAAWINAAWGQDEPMNEATKAALNAAYKQQP